MSVTIKTTTLKYKDPSTGEYKGVDAIAETTTAEQVAAVEAAGAEQVDAVEDKGAEVLESIPSDYTELAADVDDLKSAITNNVLGLDYYSLKSVQDEYGVTEVLTPADLTKDYNGTSTWIYTQEVVDADAPTSKTYTLVVNDLKIISGVGKLRIYDANFTTLLLDDITTAGAYKFTTHSSYAGIGLRLQVSTGSTGAAGEYHAKGIYIYDADIADANPPRSVEAKINAVSGYGTNLFVAENIKSNKRLDSEGGIMDATGYFVSDYIPVVPGMTYVKNSPTNDNYHRICVCDYAKVAISETVSTGNTITIPDGGCFVIFSGLMTETNQASFYVISAIDSYARNNPQLTGILGKNGLSVSQATLAANAVIAIDNYPYYLKKNDALSFYAKIGSAGYSSITIGKGSSAYRGDYVQIGGTNIVFIHYEDSESEVKRTPHGLTISDYIMVTMYHDNDGVLRVYLNTASGSFTAEYDAGYQAFSGKPFARTNKELLDVKFSATNGDLRKPLWLVGDSYFSVTDDRPMGQIKNMGFWDGFAVSSLAGENSQQAWAELNRMLNIGIPKYLIWYLGMNDTDSTYATYLQYVKDLCETYGITLILNRVPTTPTQDKETISDYVTESGLRYIDSYTAVGTDSSGGWYTGYLSSDEVHPTEIGAEALAFRMLVDVPEVMMYGFTVPAGE